MAHTTTPWEVAGPVNARGRCYRIQPAVANGEPYTSGDIYASAISDAVLIAAAPNLLEAAKATLSALDMVLASIRRQGERDAVNSSIKRLSEAIVQAELSPW